MISGMGDVLHRIGDGRGAAGQRQSLDAYSDRCLRRIWKAERFSWWFTSLMHKFPEDSQITAKFQNAELDYLVHSHAGSLTMAENYVGLPLDFAEPSGRA